MKLLIVALCLWAYKGNFDDAQAAERNDSLEKRERKSFHPTSPSNIKRVFGKKDKDDEANVTERYVPDNPDSTMKKKQPCDDTLERHQELIRVKKPLPSPVNTNERPKTHSMPPAPSDKKGFSKRRDRASVKPHKDPMKRYQTLQKKVSTPLKDEVPITVQNPVYKSGPVQNPLYKAGKAELNRQDKDLEE